MTDIQREIDAKLELIAIYRYQLAELEAAYEAELERVRQRHEPRIKNQRSLIQTVEKELLKAARKHKAELFGEDGDLVELPHGRILRHLKRVVHRARGVLEALKKLGRKDAIKVAESVNWDLLSKWSDDELREIGTYRKEKEEFSYEISGGKRI